MNLPGFIRTACIRRLARVTAYAFGVTAPALRGPAGAALEGYAAFTSAEAQRVLSSGTGLRQIQFRLFVNAVSLGKRLRLVLAIRSPARATAVMRSLYRIIGVRFESAGSEFRISQCFFSSRYSPDICRFISSLDAGLFAGLSGGSGLEFRQRMTEGASVCAGVLQGVLR